MTLSYLAMLLFKHYLADFVFQTDAMVTGKAIYSNLDGIFHSLLHGILTFWITYVFTGNSWVSLGVGLVDFSMHYHIDWIKMNFGNRDITNRLFWNHLGLDQLAHQLTYVWFASYIGYYYE